MTQVITRPQVASEAINGDFKGKDILSLDQFSIDDLFGVFELAQQMKQIVVHNRSSKLLEGMMVALLFCEPSSRTFGSFAAAVKRLGGQTLEMQNPDTASSLAKGESFEDTIQTLEAYTDAIVLRHKVSGSARVAAQAAGVPILNAGDGNNEHPTQTLLDLFTVFETFGRLDNIKGLLAGDILNSRTLHSLIRGLSLFENNTLYLLSPQMLRLSCEDLADFRARGIQLIEITNEDEIPTDCDFWYWTRIQKERFASLSGYDQLKRETILVTPELLNKYGRRDMILMDPLPRVNTIDPAVDADERAVYLRSQVRNGLYTRMALLALVLGRA